jgi:hypothetical protein
MCNQCVRRRIPVVLSVGVACLLAVVQAWAHNQIDIGHNAAGQLKMITEIQQPFPMPVSIFGGVPGYALASVGMESASTDDPANDFFALPLQTDIQIILVGADPNIFMYNFQGTGILPIGGAWPCGHPFFHLHPLYQINPGVPAAPYGLHLRAHDVSGTYTDSDVFTLLFTPQCNGDANVNGAVDIDDLLEVINGWGQCLECNCSSDLTGDCFTNGDDLMVVINNWGMCK